MLYEVFYEIIGSRCNGTYLVNAKSSAEAKKIVLAVDEDYVCRGQVTTKIGEYDTLIKVKPVDGCILIPLVTDGEKWDYCLEPNDLKKVKKEGSYYQLECGT